MTDKLNMDGAATTSTGQALVTPELKRSAAIDIALVVSTLLLVKSILVEVEALWTYAGPISLLAAIAVASWRLMQNGENWADLGLARPQNMKVTLVWTLAALVLTMATGVLLEILTSAFAGGGGGDARDANGGRFADLPGSISVYLYWLAAAWIIGGFVEEMLFRGFLITRFERLFARFPFGLVAAVILPAILFGQSHYYYQGLNGALATGAVAMVSGILYLLMKRSLWPLTLSHGLSNTIGLTLIYTGVQPAG